MEAVTHLVRPAAVEQIVGRVARSDGDHYVVRTGRGELAATRAASCLLEPGAGDLVLLVRSSTEGCYVLSVLERGSGRARVSFGADVELCSDGELSLRGDRGVRVLSEGGIELLSKRLAAVAREGKFVLRSLSLLSEGLHAETGKLKFLSQAVEATVERLSAKFGNVYRKVEELEQVRAGQLHLRVDGNLDLRGKNSLLTAERLVKLNADQIHMG
jgi:hypothetical protein